jgi:uncharacterized protein YkwD
VYGSRRCSRSPTDDPADQARNDPARVRPHRPEVTAGRRRPRRQPAAQLVVALRKPGVTPDQRKELADKLLAMGNDGTRELARYAAADAAARRDAYAGRVERAAKDAAAARAKENGGQPKVTAEVAALRAASLAVSRRPQLPAEAIRERCDPAVARLTALLWVTPEQAVQQQPDLPAARADVLDLARTYHAAAAKLSPADRTGVPALPPVEELDQALAAAEQTACLLALSAAPADRAALLGNQRVAAAMDAQEAASVAELNRIRLLLGVGALAIDPKLCDASRDHSRDMKEMNFFEHESPVAGKETPWKRAARAGTSAVAENLFEGRESGKEAIDGWWHSPGHHANLVRPAKRVGVGRHETYWTQMFGQ